MRLEDVTCEIIMSDIYKLSFLNERYEMLPEMAGLKKNKNTITLFDDKYIEQYYNEYEKIKVMGMSEERYQAFRLKGIKHEKKKEVNTLLSFEKEYFSNLSGSIKKPIRNIVNKYDTRYNIEIRNKPESIEEFNDFIERWKILREERHHLMNVGYDKNFIKINYPIYPEKLTGSFFYIDGLLIGYSILEQVQGNLFNLLFRKVDTSYNSLCQYVDYISFKRLFEICSDNIIINLEGDRNDSKRRFYKTHSFNVPQRELTTYTISIIK